MHYVNSCCQLNTATTAANDEGMECHVTHFPDHIP